MADLDVRIVTLPPMRVLSFYAFCAEPEEAALKRLQEWATPRGLLDDPASYRIFGFDDPAPTPGSPNRGYEFWLTVGPAVQGDAAVPVKQFAGGRYAVTRCPVTNPWQDIPSTWKKLVEWCEGSAYRMGRHQWLEEHIELPPAPPLVFTLDLHLPILE